MHPIHIYIHVYVCACVPLWAPSKLFVVATRTCAPIARLQQHYYQVLMCILLQPLICFSISISFVFRLSLPLRWFQRFLIKRLLESGSEASMLLPRLRLLLFCIYNNSNGRALWFIYMHPIASLTAAIAHKYTHTRTHARVRVPRRQFARNQVLAVPVVLHQQRVNAK